MCGSFFVALERLFQCLSYDFRKKKKSVTSLPTHPALEMIEHIMIESTLQEL